MNTVTQEQVVDALRHVAAPGRDRDVVAAGLIKGVVVRDRHVGFSIEVAPNEGPASEPLRRACEEAAKAVPGVLSVTAVLTAHSEGSPSPSSPQQPRHGPSSGSQAATGSAIELPGVRAIIAVASGKGGVGKSTVAVNLAVALARQGRRVGLLDADVYGPSIPRMLQISEKPDTVDGERLVPIERCGVKTMSIGFMVNEDTPMIWRGPMVQSAITQMMAQVDWGDLDILIVDMPPGTGDAQLTMAQRVSLAGAVIVSTPQEVALTDTRKGIAMFEKTRVPILGVVENMAWFEDPAGNRHYLFGQGGARRVAEKFGARFLGEIPLMQRVREASDEGQPVVAADPDGPEANAFLTVASAVDEAVDEALGTSAKPAPRIEIS